MNTRLITDATIPTSLVDNGMGLVDCGLIATVHPWIAIRKSLKRFHWDCRHLDDDGGYLLQHARNLSDDIVDLPQGCDSFFQFGGGFLGIIGCGLNIRDDA